MARTLSIRSRLVGILLLVIVAFGGATLLISVLIARRAVRSLSHDLIARQADGVAAQLEGFFAPVRGAIDIGEGWGKEGILDPDQPDRLRPLLQPVLERFPQMSAALVADDRGGLPIGPPSTGADTLRPGTGAQPGRAQTPHRTSSARTSRR